MKIDTLTVQVPIEVAIRVRDGAPLARAEAVANVTVLVEGAADRVSPREQDEMERLAELEHAGAQSSA